jgi:hypothetical protein
MIGIHFFPPNDTGLSVELTTRYGFVEINGQLWLMYVTTKDLSRNLQTANHNGAWNDFANLGLCDGASAITTRNAPGINDNKNHVNMVFLASTGSGLTSSNSRMPGPTVLTELYGGGADKAYFHLPLPL